MQSQRAFDAAGIPRAEAVALLAAVSGRTRVQILAGSQPIAADALARFGALAARRRAGEPLAYLVGHREFHGRSFAVEPAVLIPRPETELLVDHALEAIRSIAPSARVLELGTGSGAIAVTLALTYPAARVTATDVSPAALAVARHNATRLGAAVRFVQSDWFAAFDPDRGASDAITFDVVVANPPYIAAGDPHLDIGDLRFEPRIALTDGADGLAALRRIIATAPRFVARGGVLIVEHGFDQAEAVRTLFAAAGFLAVASHRDLAGIERICVGVRPD